MRRTENACSGFGFGAPNEPRFGRAHFHASAVSGGERHVMQRESCLAKKQKRSGHHEFVVVRMRGNRHRGPLLVSGFPHEKATGLPVSADLSAAKIISWVRAAS